MSSGRECPTRVRSTTIMPVYSMCPTCGTGYNLDDSLQGKRVICRTCNDSFLVTETYRSAPQLPVAHPVQQRGGGRRGAGHAPDVRLPTPRPQDLPRRGRPRREPEAPGMHPGVIAVLIAAPLLLVLAGILLVLWLSQPSDVVAGG